MPHRTCVGSVLVPALTAHAMTVSVVHAATLASPRTWHLKPDTWNLLAPPRLADPSDAINLHLDLGQLRSHRGARGWILGEELLIDCIHAIKILHVSQENTHPYYVTKRAARSFEDGPDVLKRATGFRANVA